jgi:hypothetical protein
MIQSRSMLSLIAIVAETWQARAWLATHVATVLPSNRDKPTLYKNIAIILSYM